MKDIFALTLDENSGEERLPGFSVEFPYLHSRAFLNRYVVPWHWHPALELFYVESGAMEYEAPGGAIRLPAGAGGLVRGGVLHASHPLEENTVQQLHLFVARLGWGVAGVGRAALICQGAACVPAFILAMRRLRKLPDAGAHPLVTRASLKDFLSVAVPGALQQGVVAAANIAIQGVVNGYGAAVAAGYSASVKMTNLVTSCFSTIGSGVTNFTAQTSRSARARASAPPFGWYGSSRWALGCSMSCSLIASSGCFSAAALRAGVNYLRVTALFYMIPAFKMTCDAFLCGCSRMKLVVFSIALDLSLRAGAAALLSAVFAAPTAVWFAWPADWSIAACVAAYLRRRTLKNA